MQLSDFNNIDLKNAGNLPLPVKVVLLGMLAVVLLVVGYMLLLNPNLKALHLEKEKEQGLRDEYLVKKIQAIKKKAYEQQVTEIQHTFGTLLKQLPDKSEMDGLLTDINQAGLSQGLSFEGFVPQPEVFADFYAEKPINIKVLGHYHQLGAFVTEVAKLSRIVTLHNLQIQPMAKEEKQPHKDLLVMEAVAKTYRYLDAEEVAARKAQENAKAGKKK
ncbi:type IV pilus assembly protein PilO [Methylophilus rhizosphaerae]|uniref:Type IV pilus assembly protein PilO n=1 Tax=Methylophilus rhizosphaerae TaxID=492660 RepID=A0A1G9E303_9PROT|nr:type 4a pilus biogenesis protein PilO [Methylophilus rhizosphaerae]SDK70470.1 type IV pilus assembly protein PilO [Methylophilus rhizosphaerae]